MGNLKYIFVHGLSGWGSYDEAYRWMPYWGMLGGIMKVNNIRPFYSELLKMIDSLPVCETEKG